MPWVNTLVYRDVGLDIKTGLPYEGMAITNNAGKSSLAFPAVTPQGNGRLLVKLAIAWVHATFAMQQATTAQLTIRDAMTERGPISQELSARHKLLRFTDVMDMPGTWGVTASGNTIDAQNGDMATDLAAMSFALLPST